MTTLVIIDDIIGVFMNFFRHFPRKAFLRKKTINCLFREIASRLGSPAGSTDCGFIFYPHTDECQVDKILLQSKSGGINIKLIIKFDPLSSC